MATQVLQRATSFSAALATRQVDDNQRKLDYQKRQEMNEWLSKVATAVHDGKCSDQKAHELLVDKCKSDSTLFQRVDHWMGQLEVRIKYQTTPYGGLKAVANYVIDFMHNLGYRMTFPFWSITHSRQKLYLMILILGAGGRLFQFASMAIGRVIGVAHGAVQEFINKAVQEGVLQVIQRGEKFGRATVYQLVQESDKSAWKNLGEAVGRADAGETGSHIRCNFAWLFDSRNPMNRVVSAEGDFTRSRGVPYMS